MHLILHRAIMSRNVGLNYTPESVLCEMKPKNVSIQIRLRFVRYKLLNFLSA